MSYNNTMLIHRHHKIPKHMGGTDSPDNIIKVTVEQHANLHLGLYLEHGYKEDWLAYRGLSGIIGHEEAVREAQRLGVSKANSERVWTEEGKAKITSQNKKRGAKIYCVELNKTWECAKDVAEELFPEIKSAHKQIYDVASGRRNRSTYKGLHFKRIGQVETRRKR